MEMEMRNGLLIINNALCVSDDLPEDYTGKVKVYAVAVDCPDEGPYLLDVVANNREEALSMLGNVDLGPWPQAVCGMSVAK